MTLSLNKNFLQPTGFKVKIDRERCPNMEYFAQGITHPGSSVNSVELPIPQLSNLPFAGDKINYSDLTISLILDEDMTAYKEMQTWLEDALLTRGNENPEADITLHILTSHNNGNVQINYKDCVPTNVGPIEFISTSGDTTYLTYDVTFRFSRFEII